MLVGAGADEIELAPVLLGALLHQAGDLQFARCGGYVGQPCDAQLARNLVEQRFDVRTPIAASIACDVFRRCGE